MKAKIQPRIELENRTKLEEVIPMATPFVVFLDPSDICNFKCKFCPTGKRTLIKKIKRDSRIMDFDLYKKIIDDLCDFENPIKVLRLYKDGEPLLNPRFADMIRYAKDKGCALQIDTTTNGSILSPEKNLELINSGLDRINISINGLTDQSYMDFTGYKMDFNKLVENIGHFYAHKKNCLMCIKIVGDGLSQEEQDRFFNIFGDITDRIFIEHVAPCWPEFELNDIDINMDRGILRIWL